MSASTSDSALRLAGHVRACRVGDQLIFLDLLRGKYVGIGGPHLAALSDALLGEPAGSDAAEHPDGAVVVERWIAPLRRLRLLSDTPAAALQRETPPLPEPTAGVTPGSGDRNVRAEWRQLVRLWRSTLVATTWLRRRSLADIAERVADLRLRHSGRRGANSTDEMSAAAAAYLHLRPFVLTTHDRCLDDSLTLIHFLATQGLFPRWVIGVRTHPFGAHSWVQSGEVILNDLPEHVRRYQPILVV